MYLKNKISATALYMDHHDTKAHIAYTQLYWMLLSGFGLLLGSIIIVFSYLY